MSNNVFCVFCGWQTSLPGGTDLSNATMEVFKMSNKQDPKKLEETMANAGSFTDEVEKMTKLEVESIEKLSDEYTSIVVPGPVRGKDLIPKNFSQAIPYNKGDHLVKYINGTYEIVSEEVAKKLSEEMKSD